MNWRRFSFTLFFMLLTAVVCQAQMLHFNKLNHRAYANYRVGDEVTFLLENGDPFHGMILEFGDSTIVFEFYDIHLKEIKGIFIDHKISSHYLLKYSWYRVMTIIGIGYPAIDLLNTGSLDQRVWLNGAIFTASGIIGNLLTKDWVPINQRHSLTIIQ
ncbi:MAG: hypothetical protein ACI8QD_001932 [Cyclobacteriaceae bacterium]|jgi:hypothetical protein